MVVALLLEGKNPEIITLRASQPVGDYVTLLAEKRIGAILCLDAHGDIAGILSERDIVRALARDGAAALLQQASHYMTANVTRCRREDGLDPPCACCGRESNYRHDFHWRCGKGENRPCRAGR
jgi:CBS domain-containing protein